MSEKVVQDDFLASFLKQYIYQNRWTGYNKNVHKITGLKDLCKKGNEDIKKKFIEFLNNN